MTLSSPLPCPLCNNSDNALFFSDKLRDYYQCQHCYLIFVPPSSILSNEDEKAIYDHHQNDPGDTGYRQFLNRLVEPLSKSLPDNAHGLDFGCGPGPTLSIMLEEAGFSVDLYDKFYQPHFDWQQHHYDFITATEVIEHISNPHQLLPSLWQQLKPNGVLAVMTKLAIDKQRFASWHYKNDPTHICFYSTATMNWLAQQWNTAPQYFGNDVILFRKNNDIY